MSRISVTTTKVRSFGLKICTPRITDHGSRITAFAPTLPPFALRSTAAATANKQRHLQTQQSPKLSLPEKTQPQARPTQICDIMRVSLLLSAVAVLAAGVLAQDDTMATSETTDMPALSTASTSASANADMPTLSSTSSLNTAIPTYPAPSVPPTSNAPYMKASSYPDGTIFIVVGAILGVFGLGILLWRAIIVCMLHRSVEKAAMAQHSANDKASFPAPPAPFYKYTDQDSSQYVASGRGVRRSTRGPIPSSTPSQTNLFFSPTAAGGGNRDSMYRDNPNRDSTYRESRFLAPGFYAAGQSSPLNVDGPAGSSISLEDMRPSSRGHYRGLSGSPSPGPQRSHTEAASGNANQVRAPSTYLDDLLGDNPEMFPPSGGNTPIPNNASYQNQNYRQSGRF